MGELRQREPRYENRALLDLCYEIECQINVPGVCVGGTGEPCHANKAIWGKGKGMKAHDFAIASGCRACHMFVDGQAGNGSQEVREFAWLRGHVRTMLEFWKRGFVTVKKAIL